MTSLNIVAHPDDDLLFLNPDILQDLNNGSNAYVVYLTAGDDGRDETYYRNRRRAVQDAYIGNYVGHAFHLIFVGLRSNCFRTKDIYGDLYKLWQGEIETATVIDYHQPNQPKSYTANELVAFLANMIAFSKPDMIRIQDPDVEPALDHDEPTTDHVDHIYGAKFALKATEVYPHIPVYAYMGYPLRYQIPNVNFPLAESKKMMWRTYQERDPSVAGEIWDVALTRCYKRRLQ